MFNKTVISCLRCGFCFINYTGEVGAVTSCPACGQYYKVNDEGTWVAISRSELLADAGKGDNDAVGY